MSAAPVHQRAQTMVRNRHIRPMYVPVRIANPTPHAPVQTVATQWTSAFVTADELPALMAAAFADFRDALDLVASLPGSPLLIGDAARLTDLDGDGDAETPAAAMYSALSAFPTE